MREQLIAIRDRLLSQAASIDVVLAFLSELEEPAAPRRQRRKRRGGAKRRSSRRPVKRLKRRAKRRKSIAPGTIADRIIEVLGQGPKKPREIVEEVKADKLSVRRALDELVVDGRVEREGHTQSRIYRKAA
jgi:predicted Rossmann fold nucleotide-binding protein DprA/Smf involved in DNA uptake